MATSGIDLGKLSLVNFDLLLEEDLLNCFNLKINIQIL